MVADVVSAWAAFYKTRDPERYLRYAQNRYAPFLSIVQAHVRPGDMVLEAGCGMGTITRALHANGTPAKQFVMVDKCPEMLGIAAHAARYMPEDKIRLFGIDIRELSNDPRLGAFDVIHSHGVLEHFSNEDIRAIIKHQFLCGPRPPRALIHYVPGEKYDTPSFGDERLMSAEQWREICEPHTIVPFNDGFDYALVWRFG